jgi:hemoglobin
LLAGTFMVNLSSGGASTALISEIRMKLARSIGLVIVISAVALAACAPMPPPAPPQQASLYQRLGGQPAITAVVDDFVANVAADNRINHYFARTDIPHLKKELVDQICQATGGPCTYTGRPMRVVHAGMHITDADFNALVQDLVKSLNKFNVPAQEQQELLGILGPLKSDIVGV